MRGSARFCHCGPSRDYLVRKVLIAIGSVWESGLLGILSELAAVRALRPPDPKHCGAAKIGVAPFQGECSCSLHC